MGVGIIGDQIIDSAYSFRHYGILTSLSIARERFIVNIRNMHAEIHLSGKQLLHGGRLSVSGLPRDHGSVGKMSLIKRVKRNRHSTEDRPPKYAALFVKIFARRVVKDQG